MLVMNMDIGGVTLKRLITCIFILVLTASSVLAITGSIGNARTVLRPEVEQGQSVTIDRTVLVKNVNDIPIEITITPDDDLKDIATVIDSTFVLQAGEEKEARFTLTINDPYTHDGSLLVQFSEGGKAGVMLGSRLIIIGTEENPEEEPEEEPTDEETTEPVAQIIGNDSTDTNGTVSVSLGGTPDEIKEVKEIVERRSANPWIGLGIIVGIVGIGVVVFLVISRPSGAVPVTKKRKGGRK